MTWFTLSSALNMPGMKPQMNPPTAPARTQNSQRIPAIPAGRGTHSPMYSAKNIPIVYCPDAPMLNKTRFEGESDSETRS